MVSYYWVQSFDCSTTSAALNELPAIQGEISYIVIGCFKSLVTHHTQVQVTVQTIARPK